MRVSKSLVYRCFVAVPAAGVIGALAIANVAARPVCSNETVEGEYAIRSSGLTEDLAHQTANLGRIVVDGHGGLSGELTLSVNGRIATAQQLTGTYSVHADCTGTESFTIGGDPTQRTANFVVANRNSEIEFLETDAGTVFSGTATRQ